MPWVEVLVNNRFGEGWKQGDIVEMDDIAVQIPLEEGAVKLATADQLKKVGQKQVPTEKAPEEDKAPEAPKDPEPEKFDAPGALQEHVITEQDLEWNPELKQSGVQVGQTIKVPQEALDKLQTSPQEREKGIDYKKMTVPQLDFQLKKKGLPMTGNKELKVKRLEDARKNATKGK